MEKNTLAIPQITLPRHANPVSEVPSAGTSRFNIIVSAV